MFKTQKIFVLTLFSIIFGISSLSCAENNKSGSGNVYDILDVVEANEKGKIHDFTFSKNGKEMSFSELTKGKVVFLNIWGTWCPPCRREIPDIVEISHDLKDKEFIVIGIASEKSPNPMESVTSFAKKNNITYMNFIATPQQVSKYGVRAFPTTFIIDRTGSVSEQMIGMKSKAAFMESINRVL